MKKIVSALLLLFTIVSCKQQEASLNYTGTWLQLKKTASDYIIIDCGYPGESMIVTSTSILNKGVMEDFELTIDHIEDHDGSIILFTDKSENNYYKFTWADEQKGIAKWEIKLGETSVTVKYFVTEQGSKNIKKVKGNGTDCITNEDVGDVIDGTFTTANGSTTITANDGNCIILKDSKGNQTYENCYEVSFVQLRKSSGNFLPLTFISGKNALDIDFYKNGNDWVSEKVTFFSPETGKDGKIADTKVNLKDFDFESVAAQFIESASD